MQGLKGIRMLPVIVFDSIATGSVIGVSLSKTFYPLHSMCTGLTCRLLILFVSLKKIIYF